MGRRKSNPNLVGKRFSFLTVVGKAKEKKNGKPAWVCKCDCGNIVIHNTSRLTENKKHAVKSCGCFQSKRYVDPTEAAFNSLYVHYKAIAKKRKYRFILSKDEFRKFTKQNCFYCDQPPSNRHNIGRKPYIYSGIDRVDNDKDYIVENCVACCRTCNSMKLRRPKDSFIEHIFRIYQHLSGGAK